MDTIKVLVGTVSTMSGGAVQDLTREVEFTGEELGQYWEYGTGKDGNPTDTRGVTETLYRTEDGRLVVYVKDWSHWQGEPTHHALHEVTAEDLGATGRFSALGAGCGYGRPLTLNEALAEAGGMWPEEEGLA